MAAADYAEFSLPFFIISSVLGEEHQPVSMQGSERMTTCYKVPPVLKTCF